jgi:hypothetical protein
MARCSMMKKVTLTMSLAALVLGARASLAAEPKARPEQPERTTPMEYGPFLSTSLIRAKPGAKPPKNAQAGADLHPDIIAHKGIAIPLRDRGSDGPSKAAVCFDTDTLACAVGWTGGFINLSGTMLTNHKGTSYPQLQGAEQFHNTGPGWAVGEDFADPRPDHLGQLDAGRRYKGLYVNGSRVVLKYMVGGADVMETEDFVPPKAGRHGAFFRSFGIKRSERPLSVSLCDLAADEAVEVKPDGTVAVIRSAGGLVSCAGSDMNRLPKGAALKQIGRRLALTLPPLPAGGTFAIVFARDTDLKSFAEIVIDAPAPAIPESLIGPGPARWTKEVTTTGKLGSAARGGDGAYVVDDLTAPENNPWGAWMRFTGLDFFPDGRAAVCTLNGDVWVVSGIDDSLRILTWKRFAAGLYHPMGLRIVDGTIYVCGRDQITRLHDTNHDGEADFYEDFNSGTVLHPLYHAFTMELQTDAQGNFYYARCGRSVPSDYRDHNALFRVSPDGSKSEQIAWGLRAANGMGIGPNGWLLVSDNEGEWVPSSKINLIRTDRPIPPPPGFFFGSPQADYRGPFPKDFTHPLCWIPHPLDTSSGGEAYIDSDRWGPYKGQWVHTSFGTASMFLLLTDEVEGVAQAATVKLPLSFVTGIMRPRFNPKDGQFYVAGIGGGWQTSGTADAGLYRVRYTGMPSHLPAAFHIVPHGVRLTFPAPLDRASAADDQNWAIEQWNYRWSEKYGSPELSVKNPAKVGHDDVEVKAAQVSEDGRTVTLDIPTLRPVMQMMIQYNLKAADGTKLSQELYATINRVPGGESK